ARVHLHPLQRVSRRCGSVRQSWDHELLPLAALTTSGPPSPEGAARGVGAARSGGAVPEPGNPPNDLDAVGADRNPVHDVTRTGGRTEGCGGAGADRRCPPAGHGGIRPGTRSRKRSRPLMLLRQSDAIPGRREARSRGTRLLAYGAWMGLPACRGRLSAAAGRATRLVIAAAFGVFLGLRPADAAAQFIPPDARWSTFDTEHFE